MPFLVGWLMGDMFLKSGLFRPIVTVVFWWGLAWICFYLGYANVSPEAGQVLAVVVPLAVLVWALWDPARSKLRFWLVEGVTICVGLAFFGLLLAIAIKLVMVGFRLRDLAPAWPFAVAAAVAWSVRRMLFMLIARSHRRAGERSVLLD